MVNYDGENLCVRGMMDRVQLKGLYRLTPKERRTVLAQALPDIDTVMDNHLTEEIADAMIENYIRLYELPLGLATNFMIDGETLAIPMAIEEPSVIAAASNGGKRLGNIETQVQPRELVGQIVLNHVTDLQHAKRLIDQHHEAILRMAREHSSSMVARGGGPTRLWTEIKENYLTCYLGFNPCDAMGANAINHVLEAISDYMEDLVQGKALMRILSNYQPESITKAISRIKIVTLAKDVNQAQDLAQRIVSASQYATLDVYRATTHNKGIMNGIDAVLMATGNDWRAVEAGVHAYASHTGRYQPLTQWKIENDELVGEICLPLAVATVGGTISVHPVAQWALDVLGRPSAECLSRIIAAVGLAQNFAALRAIVSEGIQKGHMGLHARQLAVQVGATEEETSVLIQKLKAAPSMSVTVAKALLDDIHQIK